MMAKNSRTPCKVGDMTRKLKGTKGVKCADSHPPLKIGPYQIWGGSCIYPAEHLGEFDIYVGFDQGMEHSYKSYPWNPGVAFLFPIKDMSVPSDVAEFKKLIGWLQEQLVAGKRIHLGCIGGHGRTGMVMAALVNKMLGEKDAITYVRKHYCEKAVEMQAQSAWLAQHFGIKGVEGSKPNGYTTHGYNPPWDGDTHGYQTVSSYGGFTSTSTKTQTITPIKGQGSIYGPNVRV